MTDILYDLESKIREWFSGKFKSLGLLPSKTPEAKPPEPEKIVPPQEPQPTPTEPTKTYPPSSPQDTTTGTLTQASNTPNVAVTEREHAPMPEPTPAPEPMPEFIPAPTPEPAPTSTYLEACEANCKAEQAATEKWLNDHRIGRYTKTCPAGSNCISEEEFSKGMDEAFDKAIACKNECWAKYRGA